MNLIASAHNPKFSFESVFTPFANLKLLDKLWVTFSSVFLLFIIFMWCVSGTVRELAQDEAEIYALDVPVCQKLEALSANSHRLLSAMQMLILLDDPTGKDKVIAEIEEVSGANKRIISQLKPMLQRDPPMLTHLDTAEKTLNYFYERNQTVLVPMALSQRDQTAKVVALKNERKSIVRLEALANDLSQMAHEFARTRLKASTEKARLSIERMWVLSGLAITITAALIILLAHRIAKPLQRLAAAADEIAKDNLSVEIADRQRGDEVGVLARSLSYMLESICRRSQERDCALSELARSNAELQQLAYVAAHDLKEPLRTITSYLSLLSERIGDGLDAKGKKYLDNAVTGAGRLNNLISDLLTYARLGNKALQREEVDFSSVLDEVKESLNLIIDETSARIESESLPVVPGEKAQLVQLLQNLIQNAIRFRGNKPPEIRISAKARETDWLFIVKDSGIGFDMQFQERIFVIFQRLHTRTEYPGTGLGLAVCKRIVERHGGQIWADSSEGSGATFYFTIPAL